MLLITVFVDEAASPPGVRGLRRIPLIFGLRKSLRVPSGFNSIWHWEIYPGLLDFRAVRTRVRGLSDGFSLLIKNLDLPQPTRLPRERRAQVLPRRVQLEPNSHSHPG